MSNEGKSRGRADIVFLIDATASMQSCINDLKANVSKFIDFLAHPVGNEVSPVHDWRAKVVAYRDVEFDSPWIVDNPFVRDSTELKAQLEAIQAKGGEDEPESLLEAIHFVASMENTGRDQTEEPGKWRYRSTAARIVVVFTDASFKNPMRSPELRGGGISDIAHLAMTNRIILSIYAPEMDCYNDLCIIDKSEYQSIAYDRADPNGAQKALAAFTADRENFRQTLEQLAKSISKSSEAIPVEAL